MVQYQSFPGASGDSRTLDKLKALRMPDLEGRSFLDVGCNEGFFCGFAKFQGAGMVVGIDSSAPFIERARKRFPDCVFMHQTWDVLPQEAFDTILLASALHYAEDQAELIHRLVKKLTRDGVLVLEVGIVPSAKSEWIRVKRGIDERIFPSMPKLREVLADYAWKWMGPSVSQDGDPVARHVIHVSRRRPLAYLLLQPPAYGKSTLAAGLFPKAGVAVVSGDQLLGEVANGIVQAPDDLAKAIKENYSPFRIDQTIQRMFDAGLGPQLVRFWAKHGGLRDFALDVYVPAASHGLVESVLADLGYLPVLLRWERQGSKFLSERDLARQAETFYLSMAGRGAAEAAGHADPPQGMIGMVDDASIADGYLSIRGWAVAPDLGMPSRLALRLGNDLKPFEHFDKQLRPDVQQHLKLAHALYGYRASMPVADLVSLEQLDGILEVYGDDSTRAFQIAGPLAAKLASRAS